MNDSINSKSRNKKYLFIGKTIFFPKEKILAIGDLHLGYDKALATAGLEMNLKQFEDIKKELENTFNYIKARFGKIEEIIFLGDLKHTFGPDFSEKEELNKLISFLKRYVDSENKIIFIRGNHEKNFKNEKFIDYYIVKDIMFLHGHREFIEMYDKNIHLIVLGHLHPSVLISDSQKIRKEKYECFLVGRYKKKDFVVVPSFLNYSEGVSLNEFMNENEIDFSVVPSSELENFEVFVCQDLGEEALDFGKFGEL